MQSSSLRKGCWHNGVWTVKLCHYTVEFSIKAFRLEYHSSCRVDFFAYLWYMHNSRHDVSFPADDDMSSSLRCVWTALPASTVGRWTEGLSLCHWHSCHLIQVQWRIRCRNWEILPTWQSIWANSLSFTLMRLGLIRHFFLCLENCTVYCMFWISMKSFGSMVSAECHMHHMNKFHVLICHNVFSTDQLKPSLDSFNTVTSDMADMVQYPKNWNTHEIYRFDSYYIVQIYNI